MTVTRLRRAIGVAMVLIGIALVVWVTWPVRSTSQGMRYSYGENISPPAEWAGVRPPPALANGEITVEYPSRIWLGNGGRVRATLAEVDKPTSCEGSNPTFDLFHLSGRLELAGVPALPGSELRQAIAPCQPALLVWTIQPIKQGVYSGTLWLRILKPGASDDGDQSFSVAAIPLEVRTENLAGLSAPQARLVGALAILTGLALNIDRVWRRN